MLKALNWHQLTRRLLQQSMLILLLTAAGCFSSAIAEPEAMTEWRLEGPEDVVLHVPSRSLSTSSTVAVARVMMSEKAAAAFLGGTGAEIPSFMPEPLKDPDCHSERYVGPIALELNRSNGWTVDDTIARKPLDNNQAPRKLSRADSSKGYLAGFTDLGRLFPGVNLIQYLAMKSEVDDRGLLLTCGHMINDDIGSCSVERSVSSSVSISFRICKPMLPHLAAVDRMYVALADKLIVSDTP